MGGRTDLVRVNILDAPEEAFAKPDLVGAWTPIYFSDVNFVCLVYFSNSLLEAFFNFDKYHPFSLNPYLHSCKYSASSADTPTQLETSASRRQERQVRESEAATMENNQQDLIANFCAVTGANPSAVSDTFPRLDVYGEHN